MTIPQWIFHYKEIIKYESQERDTMKNMLLMVSAIINPANAKVYMDMEQLDKFKGEIKNEEFGELFDELKDMIPKALKVKATGLSKKKKFELKKYSEIEDKRGLNFNE